MKVAYTAGDPAGIGLEIYKKSQIAAAELGIELLLVDDISALEKIKASQTLAGPSVAAGKHAYQSLKRAHQLALAKEVQAIITGPVAKSSLNMAGYKFNGQTEVLAHLNNLSSNDIEMIFIYKNFCTLLVTRHIAIKDAADLFSSRLSDAIEHGILAMKDLFKIENPRLGLAGLNPHAGETALFGDEEIKLKPTLIKLRDKYPQASISEFLSADALFAQAAQNLLQAQHSSSQASHSSSQAQHSSLRAQRSNPLPYDLYLAAYHDQALPLIKGISGFGAVNLSYGLPYIRVSMDHGTGFDIAGKGIASEDGLIACLQLLAKLG